MTKERFAQFLLAAGVGLAAACGTDDDCASSRSCPEHDGDAAGNSTDHGGGGAGASLGGSKANAGGESSAGEDHGGGGNAGAGDASNEGGAAGATQAGEVAVQVVGHASGKGLANAVVFVNSADGSLVSKTRTDANGNCTVELPMSSTVTAAWVKTIDVAGKPYTSREFMTVVAPPANTVFRIYDPEDVLIAPQISPMSLAIKTTPISGVVKSREFISCGFGGGISADSDVFEYDQFKGCGETTFDLFVFANDSTSMHVAFGTALDVPFVPGGKLVRTVPTSSTGFITSKLTVSPIPQGSTQLSYTISGYRTGRAAPLSRGPDVLEPNVDEVLEARLPDIDFERYSQFGYLQLSSGLFEAKSFFERSGTSLSASREWAPTRLATFHASDTAVDRSMPGNTRVSWALDKTGTLGDAVELKLNSYPNQVSWTVIAPAARTGSVIYPELPAELDELSLDLDTSMEVSANHVDLILGSDYATFLSQRSVSLNKNADWTHLYFSTGGP